VMAGGVAHILEIVVLPAGTDAALAAAGGGAIASLGGLCPLAATRAKLAYRSPTHAYHLKVS
jgi:hypothetical protein